MPCSLTFPRHLIKSLMLSSVINYLIMVINGQLLSWIQDYRASRTGPADLATARPILTKSPTANLQFLTFVLSHYSSPLYQISLFFFMQLQVPLEIFWSPHT